MKNPTFMLHTHRKSSSETNTGMSFTTDNETQRDHSSEEVEAAEGMTLLLFVINRRAENKIKHVVKKRYENMLGFSISTMKSNQ